MLCLSVLLIKVREPFVMVRWRLAFPDLVAMVIGRRDLPNYLVAIYLLPTFILSDNGMANKD